MCDIKTSFTQSDLPDQISNETSIFMHMTKQRPFLEAQNFHHKLQILLEAIFGCKTPSKTCRSHDYFQYDHCAYHHITVFNGVIEPQQDGRLHWHIMLDSSVLSSELLENAAAASSMALQTQIGKILDSITCTTDHVKFINGTIGTMICFLQFNTVVNVSHLSSWMMEVDHQTPPPNHHMVKIYSWELLMTEYTILLLP
jgi:hypothetical protein